MVLAAASAEPSRRLTRVPMASLGLAWLPSVRVRHAGPHKVQGNPIPGSVEPIQVNRRWCVVVVGNDVQAAVAVQIRDGHGPAVQQAVAAGSAGNVHETALAPVIKETIALVTVPRAFTHEVVAEEETRFIIFDVCDRTLCER